MDTWLSKPDIWNCPDFCRAHSSVRMQVGSKLELYFQIWTNKTMHALATSAEHVNLDSLSPKKKLDSCPFLFFSFSVFQKKRAMYGDHFYIFFYPVTQRYTELLWILRGKKRQCIQPIRCILRLHIQQYVKWWNRYSQFNFLLALQAPVKY